MFLGLLRLSYGWETVKKNCKLVVEIRTDLKRFKSNK